MSEENAFWVLSAICEILNPSNYWKNLLGTLIDQVFIFIFILFLFLFFIFIFFFYFLFFFFFFYFLLFIFIFF